MIVVAARHIGHRQKAIDGNDRWISQDSTIDIDASLEVIRKMISARGMIGEI